jgi:squalene-associated FAD-dependent desaturase
VSKHVVVIGGGFAGLNAATRLASAGARVTLLEKRGQLGGRAYSVVDETSGDVIDNGQHLFMGCYHATRSFLSRIGTESKLRFATRLDVAFADAASGTQARLRAPDLPAPLALFSGLLGFAALPFRDKLATLKVGAALKLPAPFVSPASDWETVDGWLDRLGQSQAARRAFFYPLALATLNYDPRQASAKLFATVLRQSFFGTRDDARLATPRVGLSDLYVDDARAWLQARGATVRLNAAVERISIVDGSARGVELRDGEAVAADAVIAAVPPAALLGLVDAALQEGETWFGGLARLQSSPIVSLHLWLDRLVTDAEMIGVIDSPLHWIFNRNRLTHVRDASGSHLSLVVSAADALIDRPSDEIVQLLVGELLRALPTARGARVRRARVIKERDATIAHAAGTEGYRPRCQSPIAGLYAAGDYVRTGLPATIESAVRAGDEAAALALAYAPPRLERPSESGAFVPLSRLSRPSDATR